MTEFEIIDGKLVEVHEHEWEVIDSSFNYGVVPIGGATWKESECNICKKKKTTTGTFTPFREVIWNE